MNCYRIELQLLSGLGTPLAADTLWGHVAWGIRYRHGNGPLVRWLAAYHNGTPPLVLSDPLPHGYLPRPELPPVAPPEKLPPKDEAAELKHKAKCRWITWEGWQRVAERLSPEAVQQHVRPAPEATPMAVTRAGVNRLTGGTAQPEGGTLFTEQQLYYPFDQPPKFDVWCLSPEPLEQVRQWIEDGLLGGYGRDSSAGLGHLVVTAAEAATFPTPANANAVMLLGPAVPKPTDPARGFFRFAVRCGRLGGLYSIGPLPNGAKSRQKCPVRMLMGGTVLLAQDHQPPFVGQAVAGVHPELPDIHHYAIAPALPCRLDDSLLGHPLLAADHSQRYLPEGCYQSGEAQ